MAGRSFRQTRPDVDGNSQRVSESENTAEGTAGNVQPKSSDDIGEDRVTFEPTETRAGAEYDTDTADFPIEPTSIADNTDAGTGRRRRADAGTRRGPRGPNKQKRATFAQSSNLEKLLLSLHLMGATFLKIPELRIDAEESAILSKATLDVFRAYGVPDLSDKQIALANALMAAGTVYGPRMIVIMQRKSNKPTLLPFPAPQPQPRQAGPFAPVTAQVTDQHGQKRDTQAPTTIVGAVSQAPPAFVSAADFAGDSAQLEPVGIS